LKKIYKKDISNIQNHQWPYSSSSWPKKMKNYNRAKTIAISTNTLSRTPIQYQMFKTFWTNYEDQNTSLQ